MGKYKVYIKGGGECYVDAETENEAIGKAIKNCPNATNRVKKLKEKDLEKLKKTAKNVTQNKDTATQFLKSCGIMDKNGQLAKEYRI